jgi:NAD(P) transhydrogenase subunit beta
MNPDIVLTWLIAFYIFMLAVLMIAGMMVSSSGRLLTLLRAKATNRSLAKVLFGKFGVIAAGGASKVTGSMQSVDASDARSQARADGPGHHRVRQITS